MEIVASGAAEAVVVPNLDTFSPDKIVQEIMVRDLRSRGAVVISALESDHRNLENPTPDRVRTLVRDVLTRLDEHEARFAAPKPAGELHELDNDGLPVTVEMISPEPDEPVEWIRPVR
jgi:hypothetical protein